MGFDGFDGDDVRAETETVRSLADLGSLKVGAGDTIKKIFLATSTVDLASLAADTARKDSHTVTGAAVGDAVIVIPPSALEAGYDVQGCRVSAANTVEVYVENESVGAVDPASAAWKFLVFDLT